MIDFSQHVLSKLRQCLGEALPSTPVVLAYLYGSAATGRMTSLSDVDIALVLGDMVAPTFRSLWFELMVADLIAQECGLNDADVRIINDAPLMLKGHVVTEGKLLYESNEQTRIAYETRTRAEYFDFLPVSEELRRAFFTNVTTRGIDGRRKQSRSHAA